MMSMIYQHYYNRVLSCETIDEIGEVLETVDEGFEAGRISGYEYDRIYKCAIELGEMLGEYE